MKTGILLSYKGLGSNLLHLSYCHEIAKKFGPVSIITLSHLGTHRRRTGRSSPARAVHPKHPCHPGLQEHQEIVTETRPR